MSLAARWISSPLPYQLGLALQALISSIYANRLLSAVARVVKTVGTFVQLLHRRLPMPVGEVAVSQRHADVLMPQQFFDGRKVNSRHDQPTGERLVQVVKREVLDACRTSCALKGVAGGVDRASLHDCKRRAPQPLRLP
jgi:hypothetical protein